MTSSALTIRWRDHPIDRFPSVVETLFRSRRRPATLLTEDNHQSAPSLFLVVEFVIVVQVIVILVEFVVGHVADHVLVLH